MFHDTEIKLKLPIVSFVIRKWDISKKKWTSLHFKKKTLSQISISESKGLCDEGCEYRLIQILLWTTDLSSAFHLWWKVIFWSMSDDNSIKN